MANSRSPFDTHRPSRGGPSRTRRASYEHDSYEHDRVITIDDYINYDLPNHLLHEALGISIVQNDESDAVYAAPVDKKSQGARPAEYATPVDKKSQKATPAGFAAPVDKKSQGAEPAEYAAPVGKKSQGAEPPPGYISIAELDKYIDSKLAQSFEEERKLELKKSPLSLVEMAKTPCPDPKKRSPRPPEDYKGPNLVDHKPPSSGLSADFMKKEAEMKQRHVAEYAAILAEEKAKKAKEQADKETSTRSSFKNAIDLFARGLRDEAWSLSEEGQKANVYFMSLLTIARDKSHESSKLAEEYLAKLHKIVEEEDLMKRDSKKEPKKDEPMRPIGYGNRRVPRLGEDGYSQTKDDER